jgi:hypothetical protein
MTVETSRQRPERVAWKTMPTPPCSAMTAALAALLVGLCQSSLFALPAAPWGTVDGEKWLSAVG